MNFPDRVQVLSHTHHQLKRQAVRSIEHSLVVRNWLYGYYIVTFEQNGEDRAQYGKKLMERLSTELQRERIRGCSISNLKNFRQFYSSYPQIRQTLSDELDEGSLRLTLSSRHPLTSTTLHHLSLQFPLSWSHYLVLMGLKDPAERRFYEIEADSGDWSVRNLERQIDAAVYERLALSRNKEEILRLAVEGHTLTKPRDAIKGPCVLEFLDLEEHPSYAESDLEAAMLDRLEHFLLELGKGFLFESRQKRFTFDDYAGSSRTLSQTMDVMKQTKMEPRQRKQRNEHCEQTRTCHPEASRGPFSPGAGVSIPGGSRRPPQQQQH